MIRVEPTVSVIVSVEKAHEPVTVRTNEVLLVHSVTAYIFPVIVILYDPTYVFEVVNQSTTLVLVVNIINDVYVLIVPGVIAIE